MTTVRTFLFEEDGIIRRLSLRTVEDLCVGARLFPEYAGQRLRNLTVVLDTNGRRALQPSDVLGLDCHFFEFDDRGNAQPALAAEAFKTLHTYEDAAAEVAGPHHTPSIAARRAHSVLLDRRRWEPTDDDLARIGRLLFPRVPPDRAFPPGTDLRFTETRAAALRRRFRVR